ncbi:hypothetical protein [uncultured Dysosmobacter sp.]|uniref:hypothetical protein n=1 Tax=uncultured Dysosmobacter sp. TaxID=2591384 RepID=UPI00260A230F|nr:hypothetical protein [uncultured Dysosmobacter sp.]
MYYILLHIKVFFNTWLPLGVLPMLPLLLCSGLLFYHFEKLRRIERQDCSEQDWKRQAILASILAVCTVFSLFTFLYFFHRHFSA